VEEDLYFKHGIKTFSVYPEKKLLAVFGVVLSQLMGYVCSDDSTCDMLH